MRRTRGLVCTQYSARTSHNREVIAYGLRFRLPPLLAAYVTFLALPGVSALLDLLGVLELLLSLPYWASYLSSNHCLFLTRLPSFPVVHLETCNQRVL